VWKPAKIALIVFSCLLLLALIALFGANLYIQSSLSQGRLESQLSRALRMPVKITSTTVSPWDGITVRGIAVPQAQGAGNFLQAGELKAHFLLWPILRRQIIVKDLVLSDPQVLWFQNEKGSWRIPQQKIAESSEKEKGEAAQPLPAASPEKEASKKSPVATPKIAEKSPERSHFSVQLRHATVQNGSFRFYDKQGEGLAFFDQVTLDCPNPLGDNGNVEGNVEIGSASVQQQFFFSALSTPFQYKKGKVILDGFKGMIADGSLNGNFRINPTVANAPFRSKVTFENVDIRKLVDAMGGSPMEIQGHLQGWAQATAASAHIKESIVGQGQLILTDGQIKSYSVLVTLANALGIEELALMNLKQAQADFRVEQQRIMVDSLFLQSQNLRLILWGVVKFNGKMNLNAQLAINPKISHQLPEFMVKNFKPVPGTDLVSVDFHVTGPYKSPRTDLLEKVVGKDLEKSANKAIDLLRGFFRGKGN